MEPEEYELMYRVEDRHWWYRGMAQITHGVLDRFVSAGSLRILDAGCGTGAVLRSLERYGSAVGLDRARLGLELCRKRDLRNLVEGSVAELPFRDGRFDLVVSYDVLCCCTGSDDERALTELRRVLSPGGHLLLRLPAYDWLRGRHDERVHIAHRYTRSELDRKLRRAGFSVSHASYVNTLLFPIVLLKRMSERLAPGRQTESDLSLSAGPLDALFRLALRAEVPFVRTIGLPFGLTVLALAQRPEDDPSSHS